jgi:hypothetical protein
MKCRFIFATILSLLLVTSSRSADEKPATPV